MLVHCARLNPLNRSNNCNLECSNLSSNYTNSLNPLNRSRRMLSACSARTILVLALPFPKLILTISFVTHFISLIIMTHGCVITLFLAIFWLLLQSKFAEQKSAWMPTFATNPLNRSRRMLPACSARTFPFLHIQSLIQFMAHGCAITLFPAMFWC